MPLSISDGALAWQRLAVVNAHPRDERIQFEEESHSYTIDGVRAGWTSCTGFLHCFFPPFDEDAVIAKMMASPRWLSSKYYGQTAAQIKAGWNAKRDASSTAGTRMHLDIEHFYNALPLAWVTTAAAGEAVTTAAAGEAVTTAAAGEAVTTAAAARTVDADVGETAMRETDGWTPAGGPEWDYFKAYQRTHGARFEPFRTEWLVFDEEHKVAGSVDMVYKKSDGTLAIYDWKRTEELKMENRFENGFGPLSHLPNVNYWQYSLQLNVYRYIIEKHYGYTVSELALVVLHPSNSSWRVVRLNRMDDEVADMMAARAAALKIPGNTGSSPVVAFSD